MPASDLKAIWHEVRPGLEAVRAKTHPSWIQEEVFSILQQNRAWLVAAYRRQEFVGFAILSREFDQFTGNLEPMVWIAYAKREGDGMLDFVLPELEVMAKEMGFKTLIMHSPRPGWGKVGPKLGFHLRDCIYAKEL